MYKFDSKCEIKSSFQYRTVDFLVFVTLVIGSGVALSKLQGATKLKLDTNRALIAEATAKWTEYEKRCRILDGIVTTAVKVNNTVKVKTDVEIKHNGNNVLAIYQYHTNINHSGKNRPNGQLVAINPNYAFELRRADSESKWKVTGVAKNDRNGHSFFPRPPKEEIDFHTSGLALRLFFPRAFLPDLIHDTDFIISSITRDEKTNQRKLSFRYNPKRTKDGDEWIPLRDGWILLDPDRYWVITQYEVNYQFADITKGHWRGILHYIDLNGLPVLTSIRCEGVSTVIEDGKSSAMEMITEFQLSPSKNPPASEFTLRHFGMAEPTELVGRQKPMAVISVIVGVFEVTVALMILRNLRQLRRVPQS